MRTLPLLLPLATLVLAACASSPKPSDETAQPDRPEEIRTTYRGANGRAVSARREIDPAARDVEVPASAARVWQAVPLAYQRLGVTVAESDPTRGTLNTVYNRARARVGRARISTYLDCGSGALGLPNADNYEVSFQVTTHLLPDSADTKTTVRTLVRGTAKPETVSGDPVPCLTTGELERLIGQYTTEALAVVK